MHVLYSVLTVHGSAGFMGRDVKSLVAALKVTSSNTQFNLDYTVPRIPFCQEVCKLTVCNNSSGLIPRVYSPARILLQTYPVEVTRETSADVLTGCSYCRHS